MANLLKHRGFIKILFSRAKESIFVKILIAIFVIIPITLMFPSSEAIVYNYTVGMVWVQKDLIAPFSFPIYKDERKYQQEVEEAVRSAYPVFERKDERATLDSIESVINRLKMAANLRASLSRHSSLQNSLHYERLIAEAGFSLSEDEWNLLIKWQKMEGKRESEAFKWFKRKLQSETANILRVGVVDLENFKKMHAFLAVRSGTTEEIISSEKLLDRTGALSQLRRRWVLLWGESDTTKLAETILSAALMPTIVFKEAETQQAIQIARESVPRTIGYVQENERIISKHERVTEDIKQKLDSFLRAKGERGVERSSVFIQRVGRFFHVILIIGLYSIYLFLFRKRIFHNNAMLVLIGLLLLMETSFAYLTLRLNVDSPVQYLIFVPAASMLLTIIFDSRVAFYGTVTMAFLIAGILGNNYSIALASLVAGSLAAYTVRDIRNRLQIFRSLGFIFLGYCVSILALAFERHEAVDTVLMGLVYALANATFSPVLTYGLLFFFERVFKVTTDLTLLELSDFNNPLLRQLSEKAPGTFHHSVTIGSLAETAADAIGANSILARVGAYYHDIGKMLKPEYFVENQTAKQNKHSKLRPRMSALVITSHVKNGIELAQEYGLPEKLIDFIPQHHGTTRVSYFYDKALKQMSTRKNPKDVREEDFCYPGPKPQTKETGIVMLADTVEAAARSIDELTHQKLEHTIDTMIKERFLEGQLDECELTLRDLTKIKEAFFKILVGIHHQRLKYPSQEMQEVQSIEVSANEKIETVEEASASLPIEENVKEDSQPQ